MKSFIKVSVIIKLSAVILCAATVFASANGIFPVNSAAENPNDFSESEVKQPGYEKHKDCNLPVTHEYKFGESPVYLTEYPEEFLPYIEELEHINAELGTDYMFAIEVSEAEDTIAFYTSMTIDEFRDYIYGAYENDIAHPLPFDEYTIAETEQPADDSLEGEVIVAENGGYWYRLDTSESDHVISYTPNSDNIEVIPREREYNTNEATDLETADLDTPDLRIGVYRGDGRVYRCE